jgi:predicted transcriptional regulator
MERTKLWPLAMDALLALGAHYVPAMEKVASAAGIEGSVWGLLLSGISFAPEGISNAILQQRVPYQNYTRRLADAAEQGLFQSPDDETYHLTDRGRESAQQVILAAYARMESIEPMRSPDLHYLSVLLKRLVRACLIAPEPPGKWSINLSRRFDPGGNASLLIQVDQYLSDLAAYRDDAHLAAWRPLGFDGPTWETITFIWHGEADSLDALCQRLSHRRFPRSVYKGVIQELISDGLLRDKSGKFQLTSKGEKIRQEAEETTDEYFYAPWDCMIDEDLQALGNLLTCLVEGMQRA